ncbi:MAG: sigma factor [Elusimicrobiota bacterium]
MVKGDFTKKSIGNWEIAITKNVVNEFLKQFRDGRFEFDDLYQECLLHWDKKRNKYQKERGTNEQTFMRNILWKKLKNLYRDQNRNKRKVIFETVSLEQLMVSKYSNDESESIKTLSDILEDMTLQDEENKIFLRNDINKTIDKLSASQKNLCSFIKNNYSIKQIISILRISRKTYYRKLKLIRKIFYAKGLKKYLD